MNNEITVSDLYYKYKKGLIKFLKSFEFMGLKDTIYSQTDQVLYDYTIVPFYPNRDHRKLYNIYVFLKFDNKYFYVILLVTEDLLTDEYFDLENYVVRKSKRKMNSEFYDAYVNGKDKTPLGKFLDQSVALAKMANG